MRADGETVAKLVAHAASAGDQMAKAGATLADGVKIDMPAETFRTIAMLLRELAAFAGPSIAETKRQSQALRRIADLEVRGATELLERGDWKKIAAEFQAIAQDGLGNEAKRAPRTATVG